MKIHSSHIGLTISVLVLMSQLVTNQTLVLEEASFFTGDLLHSHAKENTVTNNVVKGFVTSINDRCWGIFLV